MKPITYCIMFGSSSVTSAHDGSDDLPAASPVRKKPYKPPEVIEYGNVARLTAGAGGTDFDPGHETRVKRGG